MRLVDKFQFGRVRVEGKVYEYDVVISRRGVRKRKKKRSKRFKKKFGHTPLSIRENIPWDCARLVIGTGAHGDLPVMDEVKREAARRGVELVILPTARAIKEINNAAVHTHAVLHITC